MYHKTANISNDLNHLLLTKLNVMQKKFQYATVTCAINALRRKGFTKDFSLSENCIICDGFEFKADNLKIIVVYRYEGNTDPADEATVYGLESKSALKGILITGDDVNSEISSGHILKKLHFKFLNESNTQETA